MKLKLLEFTATHDLNDYKHFCITAPEGHIPSPKVLGALLYGADVYVDVNLKAMTDSEEPVRLNQLLINSGIDNGPAILGITHINRLFTPAGQKILQELKNFINAPYHKVILCGTKEELATLFEEISSLKTAIPAKNYWSVQIPTIEEYVRMAEYILLRNRYILSSDAQQALFALWKKERGKLVGKNEMQVAEIIKNNIITRCLHHVEKNVAITEDGIRIITMDDIPEKLF